MDFPPEEVAGEHCHNFLARFVGNADGKVAAQTITNGRESFTSLSSKIILTTFSTHHEIAGSRRGLSWCRIFDADGDVDDTYATPGDDCDG